MFTTVIRTVLIAVLPKAASDLYAYMFEEDEPKKLKGNAITKPRKISDTTHITQHMYDFICREHKYWKENQHKLSNGGFAYTQQDLTDYLNQIMGTNKSRASMARVFNGHINRNDLAVGTPIFIQTNKVN